LKNEGQVAKRGTFWISGSCSCEELVCAYASGVRETTYGHVGDKMVHVMAALPPTDGKTTAEISNKHSDKSVDDEVGCDGEMASVVGSKHDLMLRLLVDSFNDGKQIHTQNTPRNIADVMYHWLYRAREKSENRVV
jgi:hypothetical protein